MSRLPPRPAQTAIGIGFVFGTWSLLDGFHLLVTGEHLRWLGHTGPWAGWGAGAIVLGVAWMVMGNVYLFQNRINSWKGYLVLVIVSSWASGWATPLLVAQFVLLLLPGVRRGLNPAPMVSGTKCES